MHSVGIGLRIELYQGYIITLIHVVCSLVTEDSGMNYSHQSAFGITMRS